MGAISSKDTPNRSCSTNASRSSGSSVSSDDQQRHAYRIGEHRLMFRVSLVFTSDDRLGHLISHQLLAARLARAQHIQAHPTNHRRKPSTQILDTC
jgi:hypothetical protein